MNIFALKIQTQPQMNTDGHRYKGFTAFGHLHALWAVQRCNHLCLSLLICGSKGFHDFLGLETTRRNGVSAFIILALVAALSHTPPAFACPCPEISDPLTSLKQSTAVFSGNVLKIDEDGDRSPITGIRMKKVHFRVNKAWKGIERIMIRFHTEKDTAACGYEFSIGNEYLVYAHGKKGNLQVSLCSRTRPITDVNSEELAALGKPTFLPEYEDWPPLILIADHPIVSVSVLTALAGFFVIYLLRKFKAAHWYS